MSDPMPFTIERVVAPGRLVTAAPRLQKLGLKKLDVQKLRTIQYVQKDAMNSNNCDVEGHVRCKGHIQSENAGLLGLPRYMVTEDEFVKDERASANADLFAGDIDSVTFVVRVRSTLMRKRGLLRKKFTSFRPIIGARGNTTCVWTEDPTIVFVPRRWMRSMKVPMRESTPDGLRKKRNV
ncbi:hypothetical protein CCR75_003956 [Bremia lactucae]|uniref:Uncharacterized protein n=1 Tax=Bremia lactucae TaxID=4779 RepID=A0A976FMJ9_BRELC|nr:hypothetical protein CCR75_003956 [Bremia lactucae]